MAWNRRYVMRSYLRSSLWLIPFFALLFYLVMVRVLDLLDLWFGWSLIWTNSAAGDKVALQMLSTMTLSFLVFTFGSMLVAIQVAGAQLTPRIIATTLLRDNAIRFTVGLFLLATFCAVGGLIRLEDSGQHTITVVAVILGLLSVAAFLFLIDYAARLLRPVSIVWRVGENGLAVIKSVYPDRIEKASVAAPPGRHAGVPDRIVRHVGRSAIVLAVDLDGLIDRAQAADGVIEVAQHVGDFVATGDPLFLLYGGAGALDDQNLREAVAFGPERTIEQDSTFAFRVLVDIAIKALSKAINDPTTAVLALDQLQRLLRAVGKRYLRGEEIRDTAGQLRVLFRTPDWEDFVQLACCEIRLYGAENFQIARRMRAMIVNLIQTLPAQRHAALRQELDLLDRTIEKQYALPEDLALARVADTQGLGGPARHGA